MLHPRLRRLSRSPRPAGEWHAGELETALALARRPDLVRRAIARRLPPVWVDFRGALRAGARRFEQIAPGSPGYFGWPAAARVATAKRAFALRARLTARQILRELRRDGPLTLPSPQRGEGERPLTLPSPRRGEGRRRR
jgi:hypothetical protein